MQTNHRSDTLTFLQNQHAKKDLSLRAVAETVKGHAVTFPSRMQQPVTQQPAFRAVVVRLTSSCWRMMEWSLVLDNLSVHVGWAPR